MQKTLEDQIVSLTDLIKMVQGDLDKPMRQKIMCLITMDAHSRDIIDKLIQENVTSADEFQWQAQLKSYFDAGKMTSNSELLMLNSGMVMSIWAMDQDLWLHL